MPNKSLSGGMKLAAQQLVDNNQMCDLRYGTVVSTNPLKVQITNLLTLPQSVLIVPKYLTNHSVSVSLDWDTKPTTIDDEQHSHDIVGAKTLKINNALKIGDRVALIRKTGGQSYFILAVLSSGNESSDDTGNSGDSGDSGDNGGSNEPSNPSNPSEPNNPSVTIDEEQIRQIVQDELQALIDSGEFNVDVDVNYSNIEFDTDEILFEPGGTGGAKEVSHIGMIIHTTTLDTMEKVIEIYGGTAWEKIEGRFLLGQSANYAIGSTGGEAVHTLTTAEMPSHSHTYSDYTTADSTYQQTAGSGWKSVYTVTKYSQTTNKTGGGAAHNNMPPYKTVYIWERTA